MVSMRKFIETAGAAALATVALAGAARADDPAAFAYSFNLGVQSDYRFRGISQTGGDPSIQGGTDLSYGIAYFGLWSSNINFGNDVNGSDIASAELDIYGGIKPVLGPVTFDLGVIYYAYPGSKDTFVGLAPGIAETDYVELKIGASISPMTNLTTGATFFWSPDYTGESGNVYTIEGTAAYTLPKTWIFDPSISGRIGYQKGDDIAYTAIANGDDSYLYWDVGVTLAVDKLSFDFRYIDTDISDAGGFCTGAIFQCDSTFVFTAKVALP